MSSQPRLPHLFPPLDVGPLTLCNRIVMGSMHSGLEDRTCNIPKLTAYLGHRAEGGVGLTITGGYASNIEGWLTPVDPMMASKRMTDNRRRITDPVHPHSSHIMLQVLHVSRYSYSPLARPANTDRSPISPFRAHHLTGSDVPRTIGTYVRAAELVKRAGYDDIKVMGSEGYLLNRFLIERTNRRSDNWGGSVEVRMRPPIEIIRRVRAGMGGNFLLQYHISLLDLVENDQTWSETAELAQRLVEAGVDVFDTGIGWYEACVPTIVTSVPCAAFTDLMDRPHSLADAPVITSNRINHPEVVEKIPADGNTDLISMTRPLLTDLDFTIRAGDGRASQINICIACDQARPGRALAVRRSTCLVSPRAVYETELVSVPVARDKAKYIAVIGAGVVELALAEAAVQHGHHPEIFEAANQTGGWFNLAAQIPGKEDYSETLKHFSRRLEVFRAPAHLSTRADADELRTKSDHVIVATGVTPRTPGIGGTDHEKITRYDELLSSAKQIGNKVAVISADGTGTDMCEYPTRKSNQTIEAWRGAWGVDDPAEFRAGLAKPGTVSGAAEEFEIKHRVRLLQRRIPRISKGLGKTTGWVRRVGIKRTGVRQYTGVTYDRIDDEGLHITISERPQIIAIDSVIICTGQVSNLGCLGGEDRENVIGDNPNVTAIGGANVITEPNAKRAIHQAIEVALALWAATPRSGRCRHAVRT